MNQHQIHRLCAWYQGDAVKRPSRDTKLMLYAVQLCTRIPELQELATDDVSSRWLGFVQGILFACGVYTAEDLVRHLNQAQYGDDFS